MDFYRQRLKQAGWSWMEDHAWLQGRFRKDRRMGRKEKRGARQQEQRETARAASE